MDLTQIKTQKEEEYVVDLILKAIAAHMIKNKISIEITKNTD